MAEDVRGLVYTTDAIMAAMVALTLIVTSLYYLQDANRSRWTDLNMMRAAYDIGIALDRFGVLACDNGTAIGDTLGSITPRNMNASVEILRYRYIEGNLTLIGSRKYGAESNGNRMTQKVVSTDEGGWYYVAYVRVGPR